MRIVNATKPLRFEITKASIKAAKCKDPGQCVIAQGLREALPEGLIDGFQVGAKITKIFSREGQVITRYSTPKLLAAALKYFDLTGRWSLEPGVYTLRPLNKGYLRGSRWHRKKKDGKGKQSTFRGAPVQPTRHAQTVCQIAAQSAA